MDVALAVLATTAVGLVAGVELAVALVVHPTLSRLPEGPRLAGRADVARVLGRVMPVCYVASIALASLCAALAWGTAGAGLAVACAVLLAVTVAMSVVLLVPINDRAATWTVDDRPDGWRDQLSRWDRLHAGRVALLVVAFAALGGFAAML